MTPQYRPLMACRGQWCCLTNNNDTIWTINHFIDHLQQFHEWSACTIINLKSADDNFLNCHRLFTQYQFYFVWLLLFCHLATQSFPPRSMAEIASVSGDAGIDYKNGFTVKPGRNTTMILRLVCVCERLVNSPAFHVAKLMSSPQKWKIVYVVPNHCGFIYSFNGAHNKCSSCGAGLAFC